MTSNTMQFSEVRVGKNGSFGPAQIFINHIVAAAENGQMTQLIMSGGTELMLAMPLEKFMLRLKLDNPES